MHTVQGVLFQFVTQSCLYVLKVQYYRALWLFGKSCKFTECREPEKRRTNFRLLKETNRKGTPLSVPRAKVVKHPKHFQRVCVLCAYVPLCVFAYFNVHSTEVKLCTLEVRRKWDRVHFARKKCINHVDISKQRSGQSISDFMFATTWRVLVKDLKLPKFSQLTQKIDCQLTTKRALEQNLWFLSTLFARDT